MSILSNVIERLMVPSYKKDGIFFITADSSQGLKIAKDVLYGLVDKKTVLFLSGGQTPKPLYEQLTEEGKLNAGSVALVDERYGCPLHKDSNERMIKGTDLIRYLSARDIPFYPILQSANCHFEHSERVRDLAFHLTSHLRGVSVNKRREQVTQDYDEIVRYLLNNFPKSVAILGIGSDGHTAGLPPRSQNSSASWRIKIQNEEMAVSIKNFPGEFKERITLTFNALALIDVLIVLAFGENKKEALEDMFIEGLVEEIPARFYLKPDIAQKTLLITDQRI